MPTVSFVDDYEPTTSLGRTAEPNPFDDTVKALALSFDKELKRSKGAVKLVIAPDQTRTSVTQKFGKAANSAGYSARYDDKANETMKIDGKSVSLGVIVAYLIPQIVRTRKSKTLVVTALPKADESAEPVENTEESETVTPETAEQNAA